MLVIENRITTRDEMQAETARTPREDPAPSGHWQRM
jgi:hypothetical protein